MSILNGGPLLGYSFPVDQNIAPLSGGQLRTGAWYDLAYVYDGSQSRLYIDGRLIRSRPGSGDIGIGSSNVMSIGAIFRDGAIVPCFRGDIRSLRVSSTARYQGSAYTPTYGDFGDDNAAQLLYDFDQVSTGSTTVPDLSGKGHTGTPGFGFDGATSPLFGVVLLPDANGDGKVDFSDFNILARDFGKTGVGFSGGDFNGDGIVNFADFQILAAHFGQSLSTAQATRVLAFGQSLHNNAGEQAAIVAFAARFSNVPEPCFASFLGLSALILPCLRRRAN